MAPRFTPSASDPGGSLSLPTDHYSRTASWRFVNREREVREGRGDVYLEDGTMGDRVRFGLLRLVVAFSLTTVWSGISPAGAVLIEPETHCVVEVIDRAPSGELVMSAPRCFGSFAEALEVASGGMVRVDREVGGSALFSEGDMAVTVSSFTLGVHFDGFNGSGSSITVAGTTCGGGWWNTGTAWRNRISSSYNGCQHLRHFDAPNKGGEFEDTYGAGTTDNLAGLNNRAESVAYYSG